MIYSHRVVIEEYTDYNNEDFAEASLAASDSLALTPEFEIITDGGVISSDDGFPASLVVTSNTSGLGSQLDLYENQNSPDSSSPKLEIYDHNISFDTSLAAADSLALPMDEEMYREKAYSEMKQNKRRRIVKFSVCSVLLIAIIALSVTLTKMDFDDDRSNGQSIDSIEENPQGKLQEELPPPELYYLLEPIVHNPAALLDIETPEGKAFDTLVQEMETKSSLARRSIDVDVERYALLVLYFGTDGGSWTRPTGWSTPTGACGAWHGVICRSSSVVGIDLDGNNVHGKIPEDFCLLGGLEFVKFSGNRVELPSCFSKLSELQELDYRNNDYVGELPSDFYTMPSLTSLKLSENQFKGSISSLFPDPKTDEPIFPNLLTLDLANNNLSGEIPDNTLRRIPNLYTLILCGNPLLSGSVNEMCKGDNIGLIDVDYDAITCKCCSSGGSCPSSLLGV